MLEEILDYGNITKALEQVTANKGAGGVDGMPTGELRVWLESNWISWKQSILEGSYRPQPVRKVEIPKPQGGKRMLGIPTVTDRLLSQAIGQWLSGQYEAGFSEQSYGFRQGRSAHQAVEQAKKYLGEGNEWVVEIDLDQFFDRVNHDKLMGKLAKGISDKGTLTLIRSYLNSGIMEGGVVSPREEGTPQGSPLSPVLSNIVLDEMDKELEVRGHKFVRYADDINIYVKSERGAERVKESTTDHLETKRNDPSDAQEKIKKLEALITGWVEYFRLAGAKKVLQGLDEWTRTRIRICLWKQWKLPRTRIKKLRQLGASPDEAYMWGQSSWGYCRMAHTRSLGITITNNYLRSLGYIGFSNHYYWKTTHQGNLF